ncbi:PQQ-dependent sugar dehydrogenase [Candidatus Methylacidithermus pantelleriae]|uniref:Sorbosone dehydrogenase n=1 Tax=Candidatus Methylacidithermus pantelleriae TaxID=2744239 RepID=A0A8J2FPM2_9BACT|nr:PQQ-dependent sugar dehydrogenase [Candidatus Methylacidithermus pantelleriae]CAF0703744.1 Sorbosone dehydrogenase [Candidatus Methylacidithermus pantelleriae]
MWLRLVASFWIAVSTVHAAIRVETLVPQPIRIRLEDLPRPYQTASAEKYPRIVPPPKDPVLHLPQGFQLTVLADGLDSPRWIVPGPNGSLFVAESYSGRIWLLELEAGRSTGIRRHLFAPEGIGLREPFGMAWDEHWFYVACTDRLLRFPYEPGQTFLKGKGSVLAVYPGGGHWTRSLVLSPDGTALYVGIGSAGNVGWERSPRATVLQVPLNGSPPKVWVRGIRNPVGLAFHPVTRELWCVVNERDGLGDDLVPDYMACLHPGEFYGWPAVYLSSHLRDPRIEIFGPKLHTLVSQTKTPEILFQAHSAPLGLAFAATETLFPPRYQNGAFVSFHGSWNRTVATGYKIVFVPFAPEGRPLGWYEDFLTGFLLDADRPIAWGRPTGLAVLPGKGVVFSDDASGRIYLISYGASGKPSVAP